MKTKTRISGPLVLAIAMLIPCLSPGCALLQPATVTPAPAAPAQLSPQIATALDSASEILEELQALKTAPTTAPADPAATGPADKEGAILSLLTTATQQLNTSLQNAPTTQAQQQAAFNTGVQTAQSAAVTFGGQYGALIAAGLGIISVLIQGMVNTNKAHQTAQTANAMAQTLAGKLPPHQP